MFVYAFDGPCQHLFPSTASEGLTGKKSSHIFSNKLHDLHISKNLEVWLLDSNSITQLWGGYLTSLSFGFLEELLRGLNYKKHEKWIAQCLPLSKHITNVSSQWLTLFLCLLIPPGRTNLNKYLSIQSSTSSPSPGSKDLCKPSTDLRIFQHAWQRPHSLSQLRELGYIQIDDSESLVPTSCTGLRLGHTF